MGIPKREQGLYMSNLLKLAGLCLALGLLAACGPVIETHYDYQPPQGRGGMQCVQNCQYDQSACLEHTRREKEMCRRDAERRAEREYRRRMDDYVHALKQHARDPGKYPEEPREPSKEYPSYFSCDMIREECVPQYHACYRSCGGQVFENQVCVANCDQK